MKIYTVESTDKIDYDFSIEQHKLGCFMDRNKALKCAKEGFENIKKIFAKEMEKYSDNELYPSDDWDSGALWVEEDYEGGYYCISYGADENYESHQVCVEEWSVEDEQHSQIDEYAVYRKCKREYLIEDIKEKAEDMEYDLTGVDMERLADRAEKALGNNDSMYESYWMSIEYTIETFK